MAITYFNSASTPADNGAQAGPGPVAITPPASMLTGDLVYVFCQYRGAETITVSVAGGQSWNTLAAIANTNIAGQVFWCRFNGTWSANPSFTNTTGTAALTCVMHVFRPTDTGKVWAVDVAQVETDFAAPASPFTVTITGQTTVNASTVGIAAWATADDNTWASLAGTGWAVSGAAQYRNTTGQDQSCTFAHNIQTAQVTQANVSKNQATLGGDAGTTSIVTLYESDPPTDVFFENVYPIESGMKPNTAAGMGGVLVT